VSGYIGDEQLAQVKARTDLVALMGEYTPLKAAGATFTGCCVFHRERSASMTVYPDDQRYHCFGCGAHGDAVDLIRERERLDFGEAVEWLARRAGITLVPVAGSPKPKSDTIPRADLLGIVEMATTFYQQALIGADGREAREYLIARGITASSVERFRIGWSLGGRTLISECLRRGLDPGHLVAAGLAVERDNGLGDFFFDRLMFPIFDHFGQAISFSGRVLPDAERAAKAAGRKVSKYINTSDTPVYHKGKVVWNLSRAKKPGRDNGRILIMEGPTDVIAADQAGISECVAVMGCRLTADHCRRLALTVGSGRLILVLDGDDAGQDGGEMACRTALAAGVELHIAVMPDEMDPAELIGESKLAGEPRASEDLFG
jgi:DNA primase